MILNRLVNSPNMQVDFVHQGNESNRILSPSGEHDCYTRTYKMMDGDNVMIAYETSINNKYRQGH